MNNQKYEPVIGLEVHVELKTKSKMFCSCSTEYFGQQPNTHTCPVCLGLPGALPVPNKTAIEWCVMIGLALNCEIPLFSKFDRKNYFYPDLPKGYQISQYDQPFAINGSIVIARNEMTKQSKEVEIASPRLSGARNDTKIIKIRRVHMEEDTGKLIHSKVNGENVSLIDFNRSGVPLVEIVTEPDFRSTAEVVEYLKKLQQIVRYLDVSNADMEKGEMRLEPNISLREMQNHESGIKNQELPKYKVEVKNINSFRFVDRAIEYEIRRQTEILEKGNVPTQETRGWDEKSGTTKSQRSKEEAHDYRYFPEPDIPPLRWTEKQITEFRDQMPEMPDIKFIRFIKNYNLSEYDAEILTRERPLSDYFEEAVRVGKEHNISPKQINNNIINRKTDIEQILPAELVLRIIQTSQTSPISQTELEKIVKEVLSANTKAVQDYKKGKENAILFLLGQVMRKIGKKVDTNIVKSTITKTIKND